MFTFNKNFLRRGYTILLSYVSWQVPVSHLRRIMDLALIWIALFLALNFLVF